MMRMRRLINQSTVAIGSWNIHYGKYLFIYELFTVHHSRRLNPGNISCQAASQMLLKQTFSVWLKISLSRISKFQYKSLVLSK